MTHSPRTNTRTIRLPVCGITISLQRENGQEKPGAGSITSDLKEPDDDLYNAAIDGLESLILAHACAGVDVRSPAYVEGIETAIDAVANNIGEPDALVLDGRTVRPQHAPGPWRVQVFQDRRGRSITKVIADGCHICTVDYTAARTALGYLCPEYLDGNALLIAASPGLLGSLLELLPMLADLHDDPRVARAKLRVAQAAGREESKQAMKLRPGTTGLLQVARRHRQELSPDRRAVVAEAIRVHRADGYRVRARLFPANDRRDAVLALEWTRKKRRA